jgi:hypothetical protein
VSKLPFVVELLLCAEEEVVPFKPGLQLYATKLTCHLNITEVCFRIKSDYPSKSGCIHHIFKFPEGVAGKILAYDG